jgi:hypothetical protein
LTFIGGGWAAALFRSAMMILAAFAGVGEGDFLADAAGGAGDEADLVLSFMVCPSRG